MNEYVFLNRILSPKYKSKQQDVLDEPGVQTTQITNGVGVNEYSLYKFCIGGISDTLPFFGSSDDAPKSLRDFCDFVMLAEVRGKLHILLIELKSDVAGHAYKQLDASEFFVDYIRKSAIRIKDDNGQLDYSDDNVCLKKVVVKPAKSARPTTKVSKRKIDIEYVREQGHYIYKTNVFDIAHVCRLKD